MTRKILNTIYEEKIVDSCTRKHPRCDQQHPVARLVKFPGWPIKGAMTKVEGSRFV